MLQQSRTGRQGTVPENGMEIPTTAVFDLTVNDLDGADIDACGDTVLGSFQVLREVGVHGMLSNASGVLVYHSQPRDEVVWVEPIRNAPSPVAVQNRFTPLTDGGLRPTRGPRRGSGFRHRDNGKHAGDGPPGTSGTK